MNTSMRLLRYFASLVGICVAFAMLAGCTCTQPVVQPRLVVQVQDATSGEPVDGATVTVTPTSGSAEISLVNGLRGNYDSGPGEAPELGSAVDFTLRVAKAGYAPHVEVIHVPETAGSCNAPYVVVVRLSPTEN
jgi:hypothetical protein